MDTRGSGARPSSWTGLGRLGAAFAVAVVALLSLAATPAFATGTTRYVATTGTDSGDCSDQNNPCATVGYAVGQASAGDTISIGAGTFDDTDVSTSLSNLTFEGAGATGQNETDLDATSTSAPALALSGTGDIVENLALSTDDNGIGGALNVGGGGSVQANDIAITTAPTGAGTDGIDVSGGSLQISDSQVSVTNSDAAVQNGSPRRR